MGFGLHISKRLNTDILLSGVSLVWIIWQVFGVEIIRPPWDDEIMYVLPAINFHEGKGLTIPQLGSFMGADRVWGWHVPSYTLGLVAWLFIVPANLAALRLYTIIPTALLLFILARFLLSQISELKKLQTAFVICLVFFDKSFVIQSCTGRMEFHALLFMMISLIFAFKKEEKEKPSRLIAAISGLCFGISITFHPIMIYFSPLLFATIWLGEQNKDFRAKTLLMCFCFFCLPLAFMGLWFLHQGDVAFQQFFLSVQGSGAAKTRGGPRTITETIIHAYRFQPAAALIFIWALVIWFSKIKTKISDKKNNTAINLPAFSLAGMGLFYLAMMRGSTQNLNYYVIFSYFFMLFIFSAVTKELTSGSGAKKRITILFVVLFCLNNLAFASFKTVVVCQNMKAMIDSKKTDFLNSLQIPCGASAIIPPNLWDFAEKNKLRWRVAYLPLIGLKDDIYTTFNATNINDQPEYIIFDTTLWPEKSINGNKYDLSEYKKIGEFVGLYTHRPAYSGWNLEVFRKKTE